MTAAHFILTYGVHTCGSCQISECWLFSISCLPFFFTEATLLDVRWHPGLLACLLMCPQSDLCTTGAKHDHSEQVQRDGAFLNTFM